MSRCHVRCRKCQTRRVLKRAPEEYIRLPECSHCGAKDFRIDGWMNSRDTKATSCNCAGYVHLTGRVFPHRIGSLYCWFRKDGSQRIEGDSDFKDIRLEMKTGGGKMTTKYGRITKKDLQRFVDGINTVMGMPQYPFIDREPKAGCFHLGENVVDGEVLFRLQRMSLQQESAGFTCVFGGSYLPKQAAYEQLYHYLRGIEEGLSASLQICQPVRTKALRPILEMQV